MLFLNDTCATEIYALSLHDSLPISARIRPAPTNDVVPIASTNAARAASSNCSPAAESDRKSTRLNSSHANISYAVFCLKKNSSHGEPGTAQRSFCLDTRPRESEFFT